MMLDFSLLDCVQEGVVVLDAQYRVRYWNQVMERWTALSAADVVDKDVAQWAPKLGEVRYRRRLQEALEQMTTVTFSAAIHHYLIPCPLSSASNAGYRLQDSMMRPICTTDARLMVLSIVDRTDHMANVVGLRQANRRLQRSIRLRRESDRVSRMLAAGMDNAAEAILVVDHQGRIDYANQMFYEMAQLSVPSVRNQPLSEVLEVDQSAQLQRELKGAISSGEMWRGRVVVRRKDGSRFPVSVSAAPVRLRKGKKVSHAVLILDDITDYEVANHDLQARKKHEAMLTMVAGISHDFNNLLSGMVGNAYLLRKSVQGDDKAMRRLATVEEALREASEIIQDLMIYARGEETVKGVLPLAPFVKEWCKEVRGMLPEAVQLDLDISQDHFPVRVDVSLFQHALMAVAENAVDAVSDVDNPKVSIRFHRAEGTLPADLPEAAGWVTLVVHDNGCGIPEGALPQVCDPFYSTKQLGSGLGLSVARSSIEQHGGLLQIVSSEKGGTTVSIWMPLAE